MTKDLAQRKRVAVLLDHPGIGDGRVIRAAVTMANAGYHVRLFTILRGNDIEKFNRRTILDGTQIPVSPITVRQEDIFQFPQVLIKLVRGCRRLIRFISARRLPTSASDRASDLTHNQTLVMRKEQSRIAKLNRTLGALFWHRAISRAFCRAVRDFQPDLIHAHDLSTLGAGAVLARDLNASLIYDAHEFELSRNGVGDHLAERVRQSFERVFIADVDAVVTVSETIAERIKAVYEVPRPAVILNITVFGERLSPKLSREKIGLPPQAKIAVYVGSLAPGRGLFVAIDAVAGIPGLHMAIAGRNQGSRHEEIALYAEKLGMSERVHVFEPFPEGQVVDFIQLGDISIIPIQPNCESYRLCLPNKLFQSLHARTPIVATPA